MDTRGSSSVLARVFDRASTSPDAVAVADGEHSLTYAELIEAAAALAEQLRDHRSAVATPVALCARRSCELVVGALGILCAGAGYVAMDPSAPTDRLQHMVDDSGAHALVRSYDAAAGVRAPRTLSLSLTAAAAAGAAPVSVDLHDVAYVVYTSGSTGSPKGVEVEHAGLLNLIDWHTRAFDVRSTDRVSQIASPGFDASVWEIWPALANGASVHVVPEHLKTDPAGLRDWLIAQQITVSFVPTPLAETIVRLPWPADAPLRVLLTGGDALHRRPPAGLPFRLVNNYGLSEATVVSTSGDVPPALDAGDATVPDIGSAIDGVELLVVDEHGNPVPDGDPGELLVFGVSVARGYVGAPELTAQRFFTDAAGRRGYRTGDLVRRQPSGAFDYLGRIDDQVQIRGFRVEPAEVVSVLGGHPDVRASAVLAVGDPPDQRLVAFVVPAAGVTNAMLAEYAASRLPGHLVPAEFVTVDELPLTANGKVDRAGLIGLLESATSRGPLRAPANDLEAVLAEIVAERLGLPQVGTDENFFLLGGHSMLGAQLVIRINERFGVDMSLRSLFDGPTVIDMAAEVERQLLAEIAAMDDESVLQAVAQPEDE